MDLFLDWNRDFILTPGGDLQTAQGWDQTRQRIVRKVLTNSHQQLPDGTFTQADYIFQPEFGLGLGAQVLQLFSKFKAPNAATHSFRQKVTQAVLSEPPPVDPGTPPVIRFSDPQYRTKEIFITVFLNAGRQGQIVIRSGT